MLEVTSPALEKLKGILSEQAEGEPALRVIAVPGGHGGVQYMMSMESALQKEKDDSVLELDGVRFLVDADSEPFLEEATIDYIETLTRTGFVITNPAFAGEGCGCGNGSCGCGSGGCGSGH